jgi:dimethylhistidine N-methyltransferase
LSTSSIFAERASVRLVDLEPDTKTFRQEVLEGLGSSPKFIPSKFFYDDRGSRLFEQITKLEEYYPTRTEAAIMRANIGTIAQVIGPNVQLIEFGSGNGEKVRYLLNNLEAPARYVPIDISRTMLLKSAESLAREYPGLEVAPVCADYTDSVTLPPSQARTEKTVVFFPGSTIGNFQPNEAEAFLHRTRALVGDTGALLIGVDLKKNIDRLNRAYNDSLGVTAQFNLNLIRRIAREFNSEIHEEDFEHLAFYNENEGRIEMHLVSKRDHQVCLAGTGVEFAKGEHIITEYSYKYSVEEFTSLASGAGFVPHSMWTDSERLFGVFYFVAAANAG